MYFSTMALLDHRACRMIAESGETARADRPGWKQPVYGPGWEFPLVVAQGVAGKPGLFLPGRTAYFCPFQPGVQQDDALRLRQGLGERAVGQESGPAHEIETLVLAREVKACYPCGRRN